LYSVYFITILQYTLLLSLHKVAVFCTIFFPNASQKSSLDIPRNRSCSSIYLFPAKSSLLVKKITWSRMVLDHDYRGMLESNNPILWQILSYSPCVMGTIYIIYWTSLVRINFMQGYLIPIWGKGFYNKENLMHIRSLLIA
jgi:hypothetical protein